MSIPLPPDPWELTATHSGTKLFPEQTMTAFDERYALPADLPEQVAQLGADVDELHELTNEGRLSPEAISEAIVEGGTGLASQLVAGATPLTVKNGWTYELTATTAATVTLTGPLGCQAAIVWVGSAGTVEGQAVVAGQTVVAHRITAGWVVHLVAAQVDTIAPVWGATVTLGAPADTSVVAEVSALATDVVGVVGYEVTYGSGWAQIVPDGRLFTLTGLKGATYSATALRALDGAGNASIPLPVPSYTLGGSGAAWGTLYADSFTGAPDGSIVGRALEEGGITWQAGGTGSVLNPVQALGGELYSTVSGDRYIKLPISAHARFAATFDMFPTTFGNIVGLRFAVSTTVTNGSGVQVGYGDGYRVAVKNSAAGITLAKSSSSGTAEVLTVVASTTGVGGPTLNTWTEIEVALQEGTVTVKFDGVTKFTHLIEDFTLPAGAFMILQIGQSVHVDNVSVRAE